MERESLLLVLPKQTGRQIEGGSYLADAEPKPALTCFWFNKNKGLVVSRVTTAALRTDSDGLEPSGNSFKGKWVVQQLQDND